MPSESYKIRVRIAPSPTGNLHIGTARTALFNWLLARHEGGVFVLRIEDTDLERSGKAYEADIIEGLRWLGLDWDEGPDIGGGYGPYRQSERLDIYEKYANKLLASGDAYYCVCSKEELEIERNKAMAENRPQIYNGKCRDRNFKNGDLMRLRIPAGRLAFNDLIRGTVSFEGALIGDIAIAKNIRTPLYNFAVVVDDLEMKITHVVRGEDHIANTPKQLAIFKALGVPPPEYGHMPLILDEKRAKLSKRFGATSIDEYKTAGFLPDALFNFMALLGWHPENNQEIMTREELTAKFSLGRLQKAGAVFDKEKLKWMNSEYIKKTSATNLIQLTGAVDPDFQKIIASTNLDTLQRFINLIKDRAETLADFKTGIEFLLKIGDYPADLLIWKQSDALKTRGDLILLREILNDIDRFIKKELENSIMPLAETHGRGNVLWPLRAALSGLEKSPGPVELLEALGKTESLRRLDAAIAKL